MRNYCGDASVPEPLGADNPLRHHADTRTIRFVEKWAILIPVFIPYTNAP
jgi:hypothetical protein